VCERDSSSKRVTNDVVDTSVCVNDGDDEVRIFRSTTTTGDMKITAALAQHFANGLLSASLVSLVVDSDFFHSYRHNRHFPVR
jgi:hypothetical protein